ncbi:MAG TPA: 30S ribosomal protein S13 [Gammaproteobacteria bacterium]|nr:30S ribosomal protein S13 [Gammaproteobacteria bacterium]
MAIVAGRVLNNQKQIWNALTYIYGVGRSRAYLLCSQAHIDPATKVKDLDESNLEKIRTALNKFTIEGDLRREVNMAIKHLMDLGCVRGIRHRYGLPVNGQRTKTNAKTARKRRKKTDK